MMKPAVDFQSHTRFHPILPTCSDEHAAGEIRESKQELEQLLYEPVYALAYPNGDYTERDAQLAKQAGYECALTISGGYNGLRTDCYRLRRIRMADNSDINEAIVKASGLWSIWERMAARRPGVFDKRGAFGAGTMEGRGIVGS